MKPGKQGIKDYAQTGMEMVKHRGDQSNGIAFLRRDGAVELRTNVGPLSDSDIFADPINSDLLIGHTRYATSSHSSKENAQPFRIVVDDDTTIALSHNGHVGLNGSNESDSKLLAKRIADCLRSGNDPLESIRTALSDVTGSFSITILMNGRDPKIIAVRDPSGYMPLWVGENRNAYLVASEPYALTHLNATSYTELKPGEIVAVSNNSIESCSFLPGRQKQACSFQWVYMMREESSFEGSYVSEVRKRLGIELARHYKPKIDFVIPVPSSGTLVGMAYARERGVPARMAIEVKSGNGSRSFMQDHQAGRRIVANSKFVYHDDEIRGMDILFVDDSFVRGTTMEDRIAWARKAGANSVHVAFGFSAIIGACHYGLDFYEEELLAFKLKDKILGGRREEAYAEIANHMGADSVYFNTLESITSAIGLERDDLCMSCLTGNYPSEVTVTSRSERRGPASS